MRDVLAYDRALETYRGRKGKGKAKLEFHDIARNREFAGKRPRAVEHDEEGGRERLPAAAAAAAAAAAVVRWCVTVGDATAAAI